MKSGFIGIVGEPNAGKSSLMNALLGEKISIVSPKPQTTRNAVRGILTTAEFQMVFVDTPGLLTPKTELGKYMDKETREASGDVDVLIIVLDGTKRLSEKTVSYMEKRMTRSSVPTYVVISKTDLAGYEKIYPLLSKLSRFLKKEGDREAVKEIIPTSSKDGTNITTLLSYLEKELKDEIMYYPEGDVTDRPMRFIAAEIIREKGLLLLQDEIPHGIGVIINRFEEKKGSANIEADIVCEKESHRRIIIGEGGSMIKKIGEHARGTLEGKLGKSVFLKLFVKVRPGWRNRLNYLRDIGYGD